MVVLPRAAHPMRQGTADSGNRTILKPDFQTGHPQPRIDHLRAGFSPDSVCLIRRKSPSPTPSPKPSQTGKADSCLLFRRGEGGQKTLGLGSSSKAVIAENGNSFITYLHLILTIPSSKTIPSPAKAFQGIGACKYSK